MSSTYRLITELNETAIDVCLRFPIFKYDVPPHLERQYAILGSNPIRFLNEHILREQYETLALSQRIVSLHVEACYPIRPPKCLPYVNQNYISMPSLHHKDNAHSVEITFDFDYKDYSQVELSEHEVQQRMMISCSAFVWILSSMFHIPLEDMLLNHTGNLGMHLRVWPRGLNSQFRSTQIRWLSDPAKHAMDLNAFWEVVEREEGSVDVMKKLRQLAREETTSYTELSHFFFPKPDRNVLHQPEHLVRLPWSVHNKSCRVGLFVPFSSPQDLLRHGLDSTQAIKKKFSIPIEDLIDGPQRTVLQRNFEFVRNWCMTKMLPIID